MLGSRNSMGNSWFIIPYGTNHTPYGLLRPYGVWRMVRKPAAFDVGFEYGRQLQPAELFIRPFSVELMGAGFDKPANARYFVLRFSRVLKIHNDRSFKETVSFEELQEMAGQSREEPENRETEEMYWLPRLRRSDYLDERSRSSSPCNDSDHAFEIEITGFGISGR
jgi:hypothetical protein